MGIEELKRERHDVDRKRDGDKNQPRKSARLEVVEFAHEHSVAILKGRGGSNYKEHVAFIQGPVLKHPVAIRPSPSGDVAYFQNLNGVDRLAQHRKQLTTIFHHDFSHRYAACSRGDARYVLQPSVGRVPR